MARAIEFKDVSFSYENTKEEKALKHINVSIRQGEVILVCGRSGCGKTSFTRMINGLIPHFYDGVLDGSVFLNGNNHSKKPLYQTAELVGSVFQNPKSQFFTVETDSEIVFASENMAKSREQICENFERTVEALGIEKLLGKSLFALSGGEKQKIACASVFTLDPEIVVMDEPTSNLDVRAIRDLTEIVRRWKAEKKTVVIAEHRIGWLLDVADRVIVMEHGSVSRDIPMREFQKMDQEEGRKLGLRMPGKEAWRDNVEQEKEKAGVGLFSCTFSYRGEKEKRALDIEKLEIPKHAVVAVLGENGAGKSTFARCLCGLEKKQKGRIQFDRVEKSRKQRLKETCLVMQDVNRQLFTESVWDEMLLSIEALYGKEKGDQERAKRQAEQILRELNIDQYKDVHPMALSGGEKQRVAIAGALLSGRKIVIYDEPTSGLDYISMRKAAALIGKMKERGTTQFLITHDKELLDACCDYILFLENGKVKYAGAYQGEIRGRVEAFFNPEERG